MSKKFFTATCSEGRVVATGYVVADKACDTFMKSLANEGMVVSVQERTGEPIDWCGPDECTKSCVRVQKG